MTCRLCGNTDLKLLFEQGSEYQYKFYRCSRCRLVNLDLANIRIIESQKKYVERFKPPQDYEKEKGARDAFRFVSRYVKSRGSYLDIGCGSGSVLYFFKKNGWEVRGLELSPEFAAFVREKLQVEVDVTDFMKYEGREHQYDLVSLRHVLEHIPDSVEAMHKISVLLKDNGYIHFEFPNIDSLSHRIQRFRNKIGPFRKKYSPAYVPAHCNEFSKTAFEYLLNKTGYRLVRWETYSFKPFTNFIYNHIHLGTKARAIVRKV